MNELFDSELSQLDLFSEWDQLTEMEEELAPSSHPTLGRGRRVPRQREIPEYENPPRAFHPALGPGRKVPRGSGAELEIVPPLDERQRVTNTREVPFRWVCALSLYFPDPDDPSSDLLFIGSGTLISGRHVLTAGHCLYDRVSGSAGTQRALEVSRVRAFPGRNGQETPFGASDSVAVAYSTSWRSSRSFRFDYGVVTLRDDLGSRAFSSIGGPLGHWGSASRGSGTRISPLGRSTLQGAAVNISGYPADKPSGTQWRSFGKVTRATPAAAAELIYYDLDTCGGHSGSPVWLRWQNTRNLVAIHTGPCIPGATDCATVPGASCFPGGSRYTANRGILITSSVLADVNRWTANGPSGPTARPTLRYGARGAAVIEVQSRLNTWVGRNPAAGIAPLAVDGIFGQQTLGAVRAFQRSRGLAVDGVVGPQTWSALLSI
jgi:V8-like Glu-specific endopeptidase